MPTREPKTLNDWLRLAKKAGVEPELVPSAQPQAARRTREPWPDGACYSLTCEAILHDAGTVRATPCTARASHYKWHWALCARCSASPSYTLSSTHSAFLSSVARSQRV